MNEQRYDNQALNQYLLGSLPEAEAERFNELRLTDEEFSDSLQAAEKDLVDGYVQNELRGATLEKFKTHYLASPLRREKVEFAKAFQSFAEKQPAPSPAIAAAKPKRTFAEFFSNIFAVSRPAVRWSFALAALAVVIFGGWLWRENSRRQSEMSQINANREQMRQRETEPAKQEAQLQSETANPNSAANLAVDSEAERKLAQVREERARLQRQLKKQAQEQQRLAERQQQPTAPNHAIIASFVLAPSLRGGSRIQTVSIPAQSARIAANLELESDDYTDYRAVLRSQTDNRILWQSGKLKSKIGGGQRRLNLVFPANLLKPAIYSIEVSGIAADGEAEIISDYSFRVVR